MYGVVCDSLQYVIGLEFSTRKGRANYLRLNRVEPVSGVNCVVDPPVPIPNTAVKRFCGDNTGGTSLWEDSTAPDYLYKQGAYSNRVRALFVVGHLQTGSQCFGFEGRCFPLRKLRVQIVFRRFVIL